MSVHDILFPERLSFGTKGGPGYRTSLTPGDSGHEIRATEWSPTRSRVQFDVAKSVQTEDDLTELLRFYLCTRGAGKGFLFKDFSDWTTHTDHRTRANFGDPTRPSTSDSPCPNRTSARNQWRPREDSNL